MAIRLRTHGISTALGQAAGRLASAAVELLFPARCVGCNREGAFLCLACQESLPWLEPPFCFLCSQPGSLTLGLCSFCRAGPLRIAGIRAPYRMEGTVRDAVHALKYQGVRALAPTLGQLLARFMAQQEMAAEVLVPVPLHPRRERKRGYNQSLLLAKATGETSGLPVEPHALSRVTDTPSQLTLRSEERRANVYGAFRARGERVAGRHILVVDDVCTTGSTLEACAIALKEAGAASVWGFALAREA